MTDASRVETVRRAINAFNDGRIDDQLIERLFDPGVELFDFPGVPGRQRYRGHEGIREFMADLNENWKSTRIELDEIKEVDDRAVILGRQEAVGAMTDVPVASSFGEVLDFSGERIARIRMFRDHADALEAAADA